MLDFDQWWYSNDESGYCMSSCEQAWGGAEEKLQDVITRLENYPTDMSCYLMVEESIAAAHLKKQFIKILRGE